MTDKEKQKQHLIDMMQDDEKLGLCEETINTTKVNRVEVIQHSPPHNGRAYTNYNAKDVEIQLQDDGKTLKIFLK
jgi:hypothetical protein